MIKIDSITIKEFRGIRELTLDFNGKNFAICGPNGTGKSGVVDALEFVLTGNISRLAGEGRGEISLKEHAPHVDKRSDPAKALVSVRLTIPSLNKTATIERSVKSPNTAHVIPNDPDILSVLKKVEEHPEIVLSRRELIRYVLATPGKRNEEVQALLHLDKIEEVRTVLQRIANSTEKQLKPAVSAVTFALENLLRALSITELTKENVLSATNAQRIILGLPEIIEFAATTSLKDGIATPTPAKPQLIPKAQALADILACRESLTELSSDPTVNTIADITSELAPLVADPALNAAVAKESFYMGGLSLLEPNKCPFCDNEWKVEDLRNHAEAKLKHLREISKQRKGIEKKVAPIILALRKISASVDTLIRYASLSKPQVMMQASTAYSISCKTYIQTLSALAPLTEVSQTLKAISSVPQSVLDEIAELEKVVSALPEATKQDAAREFLTIAQERLEVWREAKRKEKKARAQSLLARQLSDTYTATSDKVLEGLYTEVQKDFASLYTFINQTDEKDFTAKLVPSMGKLGFNVDFYGRGFFPPGAYHSEGHQDGMGLCLYLALMRHLQGAEFTFVVLDDVLMSVDTGHRREVCALLKKEFPNTQFVMTTHDPIWMRHMRTEGVIDSRGAIQFRTWDVNHGPTQWDGRDVWAEMSDYLDKNDVRAAAALLRHYLEYTSTELCHRLRAPVEFRADAQYQLGELFPAAITHLRKLYGRGKEAANSWNQKEIVKAITVFDSEFGKLVDSSKIDQWQVNVAVHFNSWDNLTKQDFAPVQKAFQELLSGFCCTDCKEYLRVSPDRETAETLRCECGKTNINLRKKA